MSGASGALTDLTIIDLSFYAPGRWASMILGDLGADVICIEMPRGLRPSAHKTLDDDTHPRWLMYQRNKRSVTLNLKEPAGVEALRRLAARADVVIESFKPGTAARLGVGYEDLQGANERLVYCSISGFGQTGPYRHLIAHEPNYQGYSGVLGQNRQSRNDLPMVAPILAGDLVGGALQAVIGVLTAVIHRAVSGRGQQIDVAITAGALPYLGILPYVEWLGDDYRAETATSGRRADFRAYRTQDDRFVAISPREPWLWERFCRVVGREDLIRYHEASGPERDVLIRELEDLFLSRPQSTWLALNDQENVSITPVLTSIADVEADPQMRHRRMVREVDYAPLGSVKQVANPLSLSDTPPEIRWMPQYGEHTSQVLAEVGYSATEIQAFRHAGICE